MEQVAKGLVAAAALLVGACGGASSPDPAAGAPTPAPQPAPRQPADPTPSPPPKIVLSATPSLVAPGGSALLRWSAPGADACTATGGWSGDRAPGGSEASAPVDGPTGFALRCDFADGALEATVQVGVAAPVAVTDRYGRLLGGARGLTLVDWEGQMANPVVAFHVTAAADAALPVRVDIAAYDRRLHFNKGAVGEEGPRKSLTLSDTAPVEVLVANYPDRDTADDEHELEFTFTDAAGARTKLVVPLHERDHDTLLEPGLDITVDFSHDAEGYFDDPQKRATALDAVRSWAYFIDGARFDAVRAGDEVTWIYTSHPDGFVEGYETTNPTRYQGFLVYLFGFTSSLGHSAAMASRRGGWQSVDGVPLPLRRSGMVAIELTGTYDRLGWITTSGSENWYGGWDHQADLWSTVVHEVGHTLMLSGSIPRAKDFHNLGRVEDEAVRAYFGSYPAMDGYHLADAHDPESLTKAYGNDVPSPMRSGRRLITKLDLLILRAVGYTLRDVTAFRALSITSRVLPAAHAGAPYAQPLLASGGIPHYDWTVASGALPDGLALDPFDGIVYGTPARAGTYEFTVQVEAYGGEAVTQAFELTVE